MGTYAVISSSIDLSAPPPHLPSHAHHAPARPYARPRRPAACCAFNLLPAGASCLTVPDVVHVVVVWARRPVHACMPLASNLPNRPYARRPRYVRSPLAGRRAAPRRARPTREEHARPRATRPAALTVYGRRRHVQKSSTLCRWIHRTARRRLSFEERLISSFSYTRSELFRSRKLTYSL
jgi:hypothetical protein